MSKSLLSGFMFISGSSPHLLCPHLLPNSFLLLFAGLAPGTEALKNSPNQVLAAEGQLVPSSQDSPLGMHRIWTTERKQKEKGETPFKKEPGEIPGVWQGAVCVCTPWPCMCVTGQCLSASTPVPWLPGAARTQLKASQEIK